MRWSKIKKRIEDTFADSVRGRVEVWNTNYRKAHDQAGEAWITIDKKKVHSMGSLTFEIEYHLEKAHLKKERDYENIRDMVITHPPPCAERRVVIHDWDESRRASRTEQGRAG
jgi:hypothetical protein